MEERKKESHERYNNQSEDGHEGSERRNRSGGNARKNSEERGIQNMSGVSKRKKS